MYKEELSNVYTLVRQVHGKALPDATSMVASQSNYIITWACFQSMKNLASNVSMTKCGADGAILPSTFFGPMILKDNPIVSHQHIQLLLLISAYFYRPRITSADKH